MSSPPALVHDICILGLLQLLHPAEEEGGLRYGRQSTWNAHHELLEAARLSGRGDSLSTELLERLSFASRPGRCPYLGDLSQFIDVLFHGWSDEMREALELFLAAWLDELDSPAALAALVDRHKALLLQRDQVVDTNVMDDVSSFSHRISPTSDLGRLVRRVLVTLQLGDFGLLTSALEAVHAGRRPPQPEERDPFMTTSPVDRPSGADSTSRPSFDAGVDRVSFPEAETAAHRTGDLDLPDTALRRRTEAWIADFAQRQLPGSVARATPRIAAFRSAPPSFATALASQHFLRGGVAPFLVPHTLRALHALSPTDSAWMHPSSSSSSSVAQQALSSLWFHVMSSESGASPAVSLGHPTRGGLLDNAPELVPPLATPGHRASAPPGGGGSGNGGVSHLTSLLSPFHQSLLWVAATHVAFGFDRGAEMALQEVLRTAQFHRDEGSAAVALWIQARAAELRHLRSLRESHADVSGTTHVEGRESIVEGEGDGDEQDEEEGEGAPLPGEEKEEEEAATQDRSARRAGDAGMARLLLLSQLHQLQHPRLAATQTALVAPDWVSVEPVVSATRGGNTSLGIPPQREQASLFAVRDGWKMQPGRPLPPDDPSSAVDVGWEPPDAEPIRLEEVLAMEGSFLQARANQFRRAGHSFLAECAERCAGRCGKEGNEGRKEEGGQGGGGVGGWVGEWAEAVEASSRLPSLDDTVGRWEARLKGAARLIRRGDAGGAIDSLLALLGELPRADGPIGAEAVNIRVRARVLVALGVMESGERDEGVLCRDGLRAALHALAAAEEEIRRHPSGGREWLDRVVVLRAGALAEGGREEEGDEMLASEAGERSLSRLSLAGARSVWAATGMSVRGDAALRRAERAGWRWGDGRRHLKRAARWYAASLNQLKGESRGDIRHKLDVCRQLLRADGV